MGRFGESKLKNQKRLRVHIRTDELIKKMFPDYRTSYDRSLRLNEELEKMLYGRKKNNNKE